MKQQLLAFAISAVLVGITPTWAHDASQHKGKPIEGEVISTSTDRFEIKTASGNVPVTFSSKTKFEHGTAAVDATHVTKGEHVKVFGTKLPSGDFVAREVLIGVAADHSAHGGKDTPPRKDAKKSAQKGAGKEHKH